MTVPRRATGGRRDPYSKPELLRVGAGFRAGPLSSFEFNGVEKRTSPLTNRQWIIDLADQFEPKVARAFLAAVERVRSQLTIDSLVDALKSRDTETVLRVLNLPAKLSAALTGASLPPETPGVTASLQSLYLSAGETATALLPATARLGMRFDLLNPRAVDWLRSYDFNLIREVTAPTIEAIRNVLVRGFTEGVSVRDMAREIREVVGLTGRMEQAVHNRRVELEQEGRSPEQVERMVARYRQQTLNRRALNIARTETVRASNEGALEQERQMQDAGLLGMDVVRFWVVTRDDRLCEHCMAVPGMNRGGVPHNQPFKTPFGDRMSPPLHPQCRCTFRTVSGYAQRAGLVNPELTKYIRPPKFADPEIMTHRHRVWRAKILERAGHRCEWVENGRRCPKRSPEYMLYADHIRERKDGGELHSMSNGRCLCATHHQVKTVAARRARLLRLGKYDPRQPRDREGQWTSGGGRYDAGVKVKQVSRRVFSGEPVQTKARLSKQEAGRLGEAVVIAYLQKERGQKDARPLNAKVNNFPVDLVQNHELVEVKTGQVSNGKGAQQWRATIGQPGKKESAWLAKASPAAKAKWNERKAQAILDRKQAVLDAYRSATGRKATAKTMTVILNPDTKTADLFEFKGFHSRIAWNSPEARRAYKGTFRYG